MILFMKSPLKFALPTFSVHTAVPKRHCRITGVAGNRFVVFSEQHRVYAYTIHTPKLSQTLNGEDDADYVYSR